MTAFGCVPFASVCPCARWVEAKTSPSSSARQTPTATASWPIATCRKPGSSPARKRSSTFSSKRRISSISRKKLAQELLGQSRPLSASSRPWPCRVAFMLTPHAARRAVARDRVAGCPAGWERGAARCSTVRERRAARLAPPPCSARPTRAGRSDALVFTASRRRCRPASPEAVRRLLARLDGEGIAGTLSSCSSTTEQRRVEPRSAGQRSPPRGTTRAREAAGRLERPPRRARARLQRLPRARRAAALAAQPDPRPGQATAFRFRVARRFGYGASPADGAPLPRARRRGGHPRHASRSCARSPTRSPSRRRAGLVRRRAKPV